MHYIAAMQLGSIVLAGGHSRRMGRPKEALPLAGGTLLGHLAEMLIDCTHPVVVVARAPDQTLPPVPIECDVVLDERPGAGPLAALATGLRHLEGRCDAALVAACDLPHLDARAVAWLADALGEGQAAVPRTGDVLHPLCAVYRIDVLAAADAALGAGHTALRDLIPSLRARILDDAEIDAFDPARRFLHNLNEPGDLDLAPELR